ncbi:alkylmercury lyase [Clostridioides difficile]|nr:alkylmercury lyase [Clostridioides difficile]VHX74515.1 alkylmercury lyase [Clostridioides difficile]HBE9443083.1 hypothetical protein [Clostridioides difficile]
MSQIEKYNSLDNTQQKIRISIMDMIIDKGSSVTLQEVTEYISKKLNMEKEYIESTLQYFIDKNIMVVDGDSINFIYPVSALPTNHKVTLRDNRSFSAMCAIDAIGTSCTFNQDVRINSICSVTGREVEIVIKNEKIEYVNNPSLRVLHINLDKYSNWAANC